ncbi:MAG: DUF58 domain-containing protein [Chthoniobacteraceae bacterium]
MIGRRSSSPVLLPTGNITGLLLIFIAMWYAGASQGNGAAYLLFFLLMSVIIVSAPKTLVNLKSLQVTVESAKSAFAGQEITLPVEVGNLSRNSRHAITVSLPDGSGEAATLDEIPAAQAARGMIHFTVVKRGEHAISQIVLTSDFPLGFLRARSRVAVSQRYIVYPKPEGDPNLPPAASRPASHNAKSPIGGDDFTGVRAYVPGESQRHIDWKAVARGLPMMTKQFTAENDGELHFDFSTLPQAGVEARLSQLALWVIEAERLRRRYSLRLPFQEIPVSLGEAHYHRCLRALALHA